MILRIALAPINTVVGDLTGNRDQIARRIAKPRSLGADLIVFPELAPTGDPPENLLLKPDFVEASQQSRHELLPASQGVRAIIGCLESASHEFRSPPVFGYFSLPMNRTCKWLKINARTFSSSSSSSSSKRVRGAPRALVRGVLTLALSRWEREIVVHPFGGQKRLSSPPRGRCYPLSQRERVRVREKHTQSGRSPVPPTAHQS